MLKSLVRFVAPVALLALAGAALAHGYKQGALTITHPWSRETAPGQTVGGGFMVIANTSDADDRLIGASSPAAGKVQIHSMTMTGGVMRMREVPDGLVIPAHGQLKLAPGGYHLMFIDLKAPLRKGARIPGTLRFRKAGSLKVEFAVEGVDFTGPDEGNHNGH